MLKATFACAAAILVFLPVAARADVYQTYPAPAPGATVPRMSPRQVFRWLDTNHDGFLSLAEFLAAPWVTDPGQATAFFNWLDTNHDGRLSLQEFLAGYSTYSGSGGYQYRLAYPWAWSYWRPWNYGWYWLTGWRRWPGTWPAYTVHVGPHGYRSYGVYRPYAARHVAHGKRPYAARIHHPARHHRAGKAHHPAKAHRGVRRHGKPAHHGRGHAHGKHHR